MFLIICISYAIYAIICQSVFNENLHSMQFDMIAIHNGKTNDMKLEVILNSDPYLKIAKFINI